MTRAEAEAWLATLTPAQLRFVETILRLMPNYRYDLSRFPPLDPAPAPGVPSVIAAVEAITARIDAGLA
jgi:hypothetical protein